ncbi:MAG: Ig-like domain-containing protein [Gemmatimonadetes bacterium]|nr:Ig-like domain-containing protein [Gemmatimonadota bacterium]
MSAPLRAIRRAAVPLLPALLAASCDDGRALDPAPAGGPARIAVAFSTSATHGASGDAFAKADHLRLRIVRSDGTMLADTTPAIDAGAAELALDIPLRIESETETVAISVEVLWSGQAVFRGQGTVELQRGRTSPAEIALTPVVTAVRVPNSPQTITALGDTLRLVGAAVFATGDTVTGSTVQWRTLDPNVVEVSSSGLVRALAEGTARLIASFGSFEATTQVVVRATVARIDVAPPSLTLLVDSAAQLSAVARDANGNPLVRTLTWTSANPQVAAVDANGRVTGVGPGTTTVTATVEGVSAPPVQVEVKQVPVAAVTIGPRTATIGIGETVQLVAIPRDSSGRPLGRRTISWSSDNPAVATVNAAGVVTGHAEGKATVTATCEGQSASAVITVRNSPVILLSTQSVLFTTYPEQDPQPNFTDIGIANGGAGTLTGLYLDPVVYDSTGTDWVSASLLGDTAPATLHIEVFTGYLFSGLHTAYVTVRSTDPRVDPQTVIVQVDVQDVPTLSNQPATAGAPPTANRRR